MASKDGFWRGVLQNAIGSFLAGLTLLLLGRAWILHHFDYMVRDVKSGLAQVSVIQDEVNHLEQTPTPRPTPTPQPTPEEHHRRRHHTQKH